MTIATEQGRRIRVAAVCGRHAPAAMVGDMPRPWVKHVQRANHVHPAAFTAPTRSEPHGIAERPFSRQARAVVRVRRAVPLTGFGTGWP